MLEARAVVSDDEVCACAAVVVASSSSARRFSPPPVAATELDEASTDGRACLLLESSVDRTSVSISTFEDSTIPALTIAINRLDEEGTAISCRCPLRSWSKSCFKSIKCFCCWERGIVNSEHEST
jgi:hypothetical protein